jgi:2-keto-4-pentenoate hydratase/2-oxohepta-3-ene-1,7-dioic acid hydratase in catechol pathway
MKLVSFVIDDQERLGAWIEDSIYDLNACYMLFLMGTTRKNLGKAELDILMKMAEKANADMPYRMIDFLKLGDPAMKRAEKLAHRISEVAGNLPSNAAYKSSEICFKAPVPIPGKILCLAGNYSEHIKEGGKAFIGKEKMAPRVFIKPSTAVMGSGDTILLPKIANKIDWEAELAVVIGKKGKYIKAEEAYDYIAGYTIMNDVSERELIVEADREPSEWNKFFDWLNGKWMDTFAPMGPCIVTKDEIKDPHNLGIKLKVNGEIKQNSNTENMIFSIPEIVEFISRITTLEPGDIIATGTPEGTGHASGQFLKDGDSVEVEIDGIGILKNCVAKE